jgi:hypothetical protein
MSAIMTKRFRQSGGYTLIEFTVGMGIGLAVVAGTLCLFILYLRSYNTTSLMRTSSSRACIALERMVFGVGTNAGLREVASLTFAYAPLTNGWQISFSNNVMPNVVSFTYNSTSGTIKDQTGKVVGTNVIASTVINYTNSCRISVTAAESGGGRTSTNTFQTFVQFRN